MCHCSVSSAAGLGDPAENTLLTEQWHTAASIAINSGYTPRRAVPDPVIDGFAIRYENQFPAALGHVGDRASRR